MNLISNLLLLFLYFVENILNFFNLPKTCSMAILIFAIILLCFLSFSVNGLFLLDLIGMNVFSYILFIPKYPKSPIIAMLFDNFVLLFLNSFMSCIRPLQK